MTRWNRLCCILFQVRSLGMQNMMVGWFMVFNTTFNNISVISWQAILLVEEIEVPGEKHWPAASDWQTLSHNVVWSTPRHECVSKITTLVVIGTDCIGSCRSNYHTIMTMMAPGMEGVRLRGRKGFWGAVRSEYRKVFR